MNIKKILVGTAASALMLGAMAVPAFATAPSTTELTTNNWRVFNINPDVPKLWDINKAQLDDGGVGFTFNQLSSGWFSVYLKTNYGDLTDKTTITAVTSWTPSALYVNRLQQTTPDALFRLEFQSAQGNYTSNDYWWNTASLDLNVVSIGTLTGDLTNRGEWTNLCGQSATDIVPHPGPNCVGGTDPAVSPYEGFDNAKRNVKEVGLSFGRAGSYASGVAIKDSATTATFQLNSFMVTTNP